MKLLYICVVYKFNACLTHIHNRQMNAARERWIPLPWRPQLTRTCWWQLSYWLPSSAWLSWRPSLHWSSPSPSIAVVGTPATGTAQDASDVVDKETRSSANQIRESVLPRLTAVRQLSHLVSTCGARYGIVQYQYLLIMFGITIF